jgi:hypothetical protein
MSIEKISLYDFADFGCSSGGNIKFTESVLEGRRGIGIDIDEKKLEIARHNSCDVINFDILKLPNVKIVDFVTMSHFLEHLHSVKYATDFLCKGINISRSFVHIRQPFFDADGYLMSQGLKLFWSDWRGHRNAMSALDAYKVCRDSLSRGLMKSFAIMGRGPIATSEHDDVVPLTAPVDSQSYIPTMGLKPNVIFGTPVYQELVIDIVIDDSEDREILFKKLNDKAPLTTLFASPSHSLPS